MVTKRRKLVWRQQVPGYDPRKYQSERLWATAPDGVKVPISLVYRKGLVRDGKRPLLLYGYGSHGQSRDAWFESERLSLLDRGIIYAIAHVRGGGEMGASWYEGAKGRRKMNTFTDFIACAEHLVREKYTSPDRMAALGGSSGGLLVGVVSNLRPDLFKAVVAEVPWAHLITQEAGSSRLSGAAEFGDPNEKGDYDYIKSYSPYDNVKRQAYPDLLITAGFNDARIQYWMPAKWAARLRAMKTDNNVLLLTTNMTGGHLSAGGEYGRLKEISLVYAFLLKALGIGQPSTAKTMSPGSRPRSRHQSK
jgi:oligopeptidase B